MMNFGVPVSAKTSYPKLNVSNDVEWMILVLDFDLRYSVDAMKFNIAIYKDTDF